MNDDYLDFLVLSYNLGFYPIGDNKNNLIMNKAIKLSTKTERKSDQGSTKSDTENKSGKNILEQIRVRNQMKLTFVIFKQINFQPEKLPVKLVAEEKVFLINPSEILK